MYVSCSRCGAFHDESNNSYFKVQGNLYIGAEGGLIGNFLDSEGRVQGAAVFCPACLIAALIAASADLRASR